MRVLATRPAEQNSSWISKLIENGFNPYDLSLMDIQGFLEADEKELEKEEQYLLEGIKQQVLKLDEYYALIFVSQNAVEHAFNWVEEYWVEFPQGVNCLAIGTATARALELKLKRLSGAGTAVVSAWQAMNSEELLKSPVLTEVEDKRILIFRGRGGRPKLTEVLRGRRALVEHCEIYERLKNSSAAIKFAEIDNVAQRKKETWLLTFFSGETLDTFVHLNQKVSEKPDFWLSQLVLVPSDRVSEEAHEKGFANVVVAKNATEDEMLKSLRKVFR